MVEVQAVTWEKESLAIGRIYSIVNAGDSGFMGLLYVADGTACSWKYGKCRFRFLSNIGTRVLLADERRDHVAVDAVVSAVPVDLVDGAWHWNTLPSTKTRTGPGGAIGGLRHGCAEREHQRGENCDLGHAKGLLVDE